MGLADMVDPRSLTVDVRQLLGGAGKDTNALGVVRVHIIEAQCDPASIHMKGIKKKTRKDMNIHNSSLIIYRDGGLVRYIGA